MARRGSNMSPLGLQLNQYSILLGHGGSWQKCCKLLIYVLTV